MDKELSEEQKRKAAKKERIEKDFTCVKTVEGKTGMTYKLMIHNVVVPVLMVEGSKGEFLFAESLWNVQAFEDKLKNMGEI